MKNVLMKNHIMNDTRADEKALIGLDEPGLIYNYQGSQSTAERVGKYSKIGVNKFKPLEPIPFEYKGIKFNMIVCPAGGVVDIEDWGLQEIKEPFMFGETEVTQELFEAAMGFNYSDFKDSNKNTVEQVSWYDCLEFCNRLSEHFGFEPCYVLKNKILQKLKYSDSNCPLSIYVANVTFIEGANGFRLPKEREWQIAAMAGTNNLYAGANDDESLKRVAWFDANSGNKTHPVAQKLPNEWGFYDMNGNVWEWCENSNGSSSDRFVRGGSWSRPASYLRSAYRLDLSPSSRSSNIGFRVARSIHSPEQLDA
jgi:sulfatase modifying factor 1